MGVEIVKASIFYGGTLPGNAFKVLVAMSMTALDKPTQGRPASLYWGGWDALALVLGHPNADRGGTGHGAVATAIRQLRSAGHITPMIEAGRGSRQSYMVHPGGLNDPGKGETFPHAKGERNPHAKGEEKSPHSVRESHTPRKELGEVGLTQDITLAVEPQPQTARGKVEKHKFQGRPGEDCEGCGRHYSDRRAHPLYLLGGSA